MSATPKKESPKSKLKELLFWIIRFLVFFFRKYLRFRAWVILIPLLIVTLMGKLLTQDGMIMGLVILVYLLLTYLDRWFENHEEK